MATLEKIRSKSTLLLIVIGVALLAFIMTDFDKIVGTLFGNGTTVAKVDGEKIDIQAFQKRLELANNQIQQSGQKIDGAVLQQQVLQQMINETLFDKEASKLGLTVTKQELTDALVGANSQYVNMFVQQQYGVESASQLLDIVTNPAKYGIQDPATIRQFSDLWTSLEDQMEQSLLQQKFQSLFVGALQANDLDAKEMYLDGVNNKKVVFASKSYASLPDDQYEVTDADIRAEWSKQKELYRLDQPYRAISYIAVPIVPSADDLTAAEQKVEDAIVALRTQPSTDGIAEMEEFIADRQTVAVNRITNRDVKAFADSASAGQVAALSHVGNNYTLAKLIDKKVAVDSVNIDIAIVSGGKAATDSVIAGLNNGTVEFASLATPEAQPQDSIWLSLTDPQAAEIRDMLTTAATGTYFTPDTAANAQQARVFRVNSRKAPVETVDIAVVSFTAEPSRATINGLETALRAYCAENPDAAKFSENAVAAGYSAIPALVSASTPAIGNYQDSRNAVVWALDAKKGQVSPVYGDEMAGQLIAVALNDIYDDYIPYNASQVEPELRARALAAKKGAALMADFNGKASDIAGYAKLLGSQIDTTSVAFSQNNIVRIGTNEGKIAGAVAAAKPGQLVGPVEGNNSLVVLQVLEAEAPGRPYSVEESRTNFMRQRGGSSLSNSLFGILLGNDRIENRLNKFFNRD